MDCADVGVIQSGSGLGFNDKSFFGYGIVGELRRQEFQRDRAIQCLIQGLVYNPHSAGA